MDGTYVHQILIYLLKENGIRQKFNQLTVKEYFHYIDNHKKYTDFNTLGLYRSIVENEKLSLADKIEIQDYAHKLFKKTFDFLQLKDPYTFVKISTLGHTLTVADERQLWSDVIKNQEKILSEKKSNTETSDNAQNTIVVMRIIHITD